MFRQKLKDVQKALPVDNTLYRTRYRVFFEWRRNLMRKFIIRDFEREGLEAKGEMLRQVCAAVQATEPRATITCEIRPQYRNMRYWLEEDMTPVDLARDACRDLGLEPVSVPIRGGTDGSRLTEMGVPTPNLFTGMQNIHGPLEWISVQDMAKATDLCLTLLGKAATARR